MMIYTMQSKSMADLICPLCGKQMQHMVDCPIVGGLVCEQCHMECMYLDKSYSLWHCMYLREGGAHYGAKQEKKPKIKRSGV